MPRLFFALWPGAAERSELFAAGQRAHPHSGGRAMRRENLHQTVVFIGDVTASQLEKIKAAGDATVAQPFDLQFGHVRYWRHNRIVWAAPLATPAPLADLVGHLERRLDGAGIKFDRRPYVPHVTLVRDARPPGELAPLHFEWAVRDFALIESARNAGGAVYRPIARWPLAA